MENRPNIILIMTDEMRGDCMGFTGHPDVKTPYLDSLASEGIYYPNAYSSCPTCVPARAVLHTGLSPKGCGRVGYEDGVEWNYGCVMAGEIAKSGYYTQEVGKMHVHPLRSNLGFNHVDLHDGYLHEYRYGRVPYSENQLVADDYFYWLKNEKGIGCDVTDTGIDCNSWVARPWIYEEKYHPTNWAVTRSIDFLRRRDPRQPFFLMTSFVRPHAPFDAPQCYFDMYKDKELREPSMGDWNDTEALKEKGRMYNSRTGSIDKELIRQQRVGYYACITHVDHQIGRLIMALIEHQVYDNTVIIFTSDHGDMMADHCQFQKAKPYQGSIHIPMIISGPERIIGKRHTVNQDLVELRDVFPTFMDVIESPIPSTVEGKSMLKGIERDYLHGEHTLGDESHQFIVTKKDKYIWFSQTGVEQYFSLHEDPYETHNGIKDSQYQERIVELRQILIQELSTREEGYSNGKELIVGCKTLQYLYNARDKNC